MKSLLNKLLSPFRKAKRPRLVISNEQSKLEQKTTNKSSSTNILQPGQRIEIYRIDQIPVLHEDTTISVFQHYSIKEKVSGTVVQVTVSGPKTTIRFQNPLQGAMVATLGPGQKVRLV